MLPPQPSAPPHSAGPRSLSRSLSTAKISKLKPAGVHILLGLDSRSVSQRSLQLLTSAVRKVRWGIMEGCLETTPAKEIMEGFSEAVTSKRRQQREVVGPAEDGT